jgi:serine/threonine protein phosphatase PrpC
LKTLNKHR